MHEILKFPLVLKLVATEYSNGLYEIYEIPPEYRPAVAEHGNSWFTEAVADSLNEVDHEINVEEALILLENSQGESFVVVQYRDSYRILTEVPKEWMLRLMSV